MPMKKRIVSIMIICIMLLLTGCKESSVAGSDKSAATTQFTTTEPVASVDTTSYERVVIPVNTISRYPFMQDNTEIKVDGLAISILVPEGPGFDIGKTRFLEGTDCLYEINDLVPFDEYILLSYYKDFRMTVDDIPQIVYYYIHNYQVDVGCTKTGYPYVYYYKEISETSDQDGETDGTLFVKVSDRYVMCTTWFDPDTLQQAHTMIDSIEYIQTAE